VTGVTDYIPSGMYRSVERAGTSSLCILLRMHPYRDAGFLWSSFVLPSEAFLTEGGRQKAFLFLTEEKECFLPSAFRLLLITPVTVVAILTIKINNYN
jgi:hypothetical protein